MIYDYDTRYPMKWMLDKDIWEKVIRQEIHDFISFMFQVTQKQTNEGPMTKIDPEAAKY